MGSLILFFTLFLDFDTVFVGNSTVRLSKQDFDFAKAGGKPTTMALRFVDKLFSKETLKRSTVHGTKEFTALDAKIMAAIRCRLPLLRVPVNFSFN